MSKPQMGESVIFSHLVSGNNSWSINIANNDSTTFFHDKSIQDLTPLAILTLYPVVRPWTQPGIAKGVFHARWTRSMFTIS